MALLSIYISLLAFIITFLSGARNSTRQYNTTVDSNTETNTIPGSEEQVEPDTGACTAVAALLHFFLLATFMWNSVYGTQLVLLLRTTCNDLPPYWTMLSHALGWGKNAVHSLFLKKKKCQDHDRETPKTSIMGLFHYVP